MNDENLINDLSNLIETKQLNKLHQILENINEADFPFIFENLDEEKKIMVYRLLSKEKAAEVFVELDSEDQENLINALTDKEIKNVMNELYMDDAVDLIEEMPANVVKRILANTKSEDRKIINELLKYPEDTTGTIMTTEFISLKVNMTVDDAFKRIKQKGLNSETVYNLYVISNDAKLLGVVDIKILLVSDRKEMIEEIMDTNIISANTFDDQEKTAKLFEKYDLISIPVVDKDNRLVGIVTIDDAVDVIREEASEDFEKMAAITPNEDSYLKTSVFQHAKSRIIWLLVLMISSMITGTIISKYETAIATIPLLASFIPMLMGTGGNCGSQSSTLIIRGLATDEVSIKDFLKVLWKEFRIALIVSFILAFVNLLRIYIQYRDLKIAVSVSITLIATVITAKIIGGILPILAKKLNLDPAVMAAPLLTTIVDATTVLIFFSIISVSFAGVI